LIKDSRTTDTRLGLLVILEKDVRLETTMRIPNLFVGLAEYSVISMEGVKTWYNMLLIRVATL
jgi:hypothetical protein